MSTKIEWADQTLNIVTGCTKISPGCQHCYAERMTKRLKAMGVEKYQKGFSTVALHPEAIEQAGRWRQAQVIFINSMSDLLHERVDDLFLKQMFDKMGEFSRHIFLILTKRAERLSGISLPDNVWAGVSIENSDYAWRADYLRMCEAGGKFISAEPLLSSLGNLDLTGIDWLIVGGETGPGSRVMEKGWVAELRDRCILTDTNFFFKQWGGSRKKEAGNLLDGRQWLQLPAKMLEAMEAKNGN